MYSQIRTSMLDGICTMPVQVEVDISMGMPVFDMVGYLSPEVREAKERVRTALHNCGILLPAKRITVNLSPANIRKTGTGFDLPIAVALLVAMGLVKPEKCVDTIFSGELNLSGQLLPVRGVLPMVSDGVKEGIHKFVVPADNLMESRLVQGADVCGFSALESVIGYLQDGGYKEPAYAGRRQNRSHGMPDFSEVNGQQFLKRAAEIAASGMHNMLMVGPPGAGKTMISERMATILPPLTKKSSWRFQKYTVSAVCWQTPGHCCRNGRFAVRIIRSAWQGLPAVDEVSGRERFHWHIMVCFFWMNSRNFPNQRWKCCVSRWRNIRFI